MPNNSRRHITLLTYDSPCGPLLLGSLGRQLCICDWVHASRSERTVHRLCKQLDAEATESDSKPVAEAISQLNEYFAGKRNAFDIALMLIGTPFQQQVWRELARIPYGQTVSYAAVARALGSPKAVRAVAGAIGANPLSIFLPCHRVIGSDTSLTGYAGGVEAKQYLLSLEKTQF